MAKLSVDTSEEIFGDKVSIAHLAQFTFTGVESDDLTIYRADELLQRDWRWEIASVEMEYALGVTAVFKDGSKLSVSAWADCCDGSGCRQCSGDWRRI
jgi:hypothetical protein